MFTELPPSLPDPHVVGPKTKRVGLGSLTVEAVHYAGDGKSGPHSLDITQDGRVRVDGKHVATILGMHVKSPRGGDLLILAEDGTVTGPDGNKLGRLGPMIVATDPVRQEALLFPQGGLARHEGLRAPARQPGGLERRGELRELRIRPAKARAPVEGTQARRPSRDVAAS